MAHKKYVRMYIANSKGNDDYGNSRIRYLDIPCDYVGEVCNALQRARKDAVR